MQRVVRIGFVIITGLLLVVALLQVLGRGFAYFVGDLQPLLNNYLSAQKITVENVTADWRLLNPVAKVGRVTLPAGHIEGLHLELDWFESAWRQQWVFRRLYVANFELDIAKTAKGGWFLANMQPGEAQFDYLSLLNHSDEVVVQGDASFVSTQPQPDPSIQQTQSVFDESGNVLALRYWARNRGGEHLVNAFVANAGCGLGCGVNLYYQNVEDIWSLRPHSSRLQALGSVKLPRAITAGQDIHLTELDVILSHAQGQTRWSTNVELARELARIQIAGQGVSSDGVHRGRFDRISATDEGETIELPMMGVTANAQSVSLTVNRLDLAATTAFVDTALSHAVVSEWLAALNIGGELNDLHAFVDFNAGGLGFSGNLKGAVLDGYKGVPTVRGGMGRIVGTANSISLVLNGQSQHLHFPQVFSQGWDITQSTGTLMAWFGDGFFGLRGEEMDIRVPFTEQSNARVLGGFGLARPPELLEQRLTLTLQADQADVAFAKKLIPEKLNPTVRDWLVTAPEIGDVHNVTYAMHGHFKINPNDRARRIALQADFKKADLAFHPRWPAVSGADGHLEFSGNATKVRLDGGVSRGFSIGGSRASLTGNPLTLQLQLAANGDGNSMIEYVQTSPLKQWLSFVAPDWESSGAVSVSGDLQIPLAKMAQVTNLQKVEVELEAPVVDSEIAIAARIDMADVALYMPEYRLQFNQLQGALNYRYPFDVSSQQINGLLFDRPVVVKAAPVKDVDDNPVIQLQVAGGYTPDDLYSTIDMPDLGFVSGASQFDAVLNIPVTSASVVELQVKSDLGGLAIDFPAPFGKPKQTQRATEIAVSFLPNYQQVEIHQLNNHAWLQTKDKILRGGLGMGEFAPMVSPNAREFLVTGEVEYLDMVAYASLSKADANGEGWRASSSDAENNPENNAAQLAVGGSKLPIPIRLQALQARRMSVDSFVIEDALIDGRIADQSLAIDIASSHLAGTLRQQKAEPFKLSLARLDIPANDPPSEADPLNVSLIPQLPDIDVVVEQVTLGGEDFGAWRFNLAAEDKLLWLRNVQGLIRGVQVRSEAMLWNGELDESSFVGDLVVGDLAAVLPQWGYEASVETKSAVVNADIGWPGSPINVRLEALTGSADIGAKEGRFLDVEAGNSAMRIFSLLNFSAIAKRINFDFSDVRGKGISFDTISAQVAFASSELNFVEPMQVEGTGSNFRVDGSVNLVTGALDNEMIVTLPVGKGLPWYGVYIGLANPLAGLGVILGERVLRKPIEQFSSAKYEIGGTLENPTAQLVTVFDTSMRERNPPIGDIPVEEIIEAEEPEPANDEVQDSKMPISSPESAVTDLKDIE